MCKITNILYFCFLFFRFFYYFLFIYFSTLVRAPKYVSVLLFFSWFDLFFFSPFVFALRSSVCCFWVVCFFGGVSKLGCYFFLSFFLLSIYSVRFSCVSGRCVFCFAVYTTSIITLQHRKNAMQTNIKSKLQK